MNLSYQTLKLQVTETWEREYFTKILSDFQGCVTDAAREAKMDRANFHRALRRLGISPATFRMKAREHEEPVSQTA